MSSRSPRPVSADLAAANAALDVCAALMRAQGDEDPIEVAPAPEPPPAPEPAPLDPSIARDRARLADLETAVASMQSNFQDAGRANLAAIAISECAAKVIADHRASLDSAVEAAQAVRHTPRPAAPPRPAPTPVQRDYATERALRAALDRYFSYFEIPGTHWSLRWSLFSETGMPVANAHGASPGNIAAVYPVPLPEEAPWRSATKLTQLEPAAKSISIVGAAAKPLSPSKFYLAGLTWSAGAGSITLSRSKKKMANAVRLDYPGDGTVAVVPLDAMGNPAGPGAAQAGETAAYLDAIWWKLSAAAMGLIHGRGDATSLTHEGSSALGHAEPVRMAEAILDANEGLLAKVDGEIDDDMRRKLSAKFDDVSPKHRKHIRGFVLAAGSNPPSFDADADAAPTEISMSPPTDADVKGAAPKPAERKANAPKPAALKADESKADEPKADEPSTAKPGYSKAPESAAATTKFDVIGAMKRPTKRIPTQPTPMPPADDDVAASSDREATKPGKVSRHTVSRRRTPLGSGPVAVPNPAQMVVSRPSDPGVPLFGQKTIDEKFSDLDLEIDWDDDDDAPTQMLGDEDPNNETLPGVTPSVARPQTISIDSNW